MYVPDGECEHKFDTRLKVANSITMFLNAGAELTMQQKLDMLKKKKEINHQATRFVERPYDQEQNKEHIQTLAHSQAKTMDGKIGIDGKELNAAATPNVNGYNFMKTPSPMPG